jgi:hypothetical protein
MFEQFLNEASNKKFSEQYELVRKELMILHSMLEQKAKEIYDLPGARADARRIGDGAHTLYQILDANFDPFDKGHGDFFKTISKISDKY